jgi:hypothetical protein
MITTPITLFGCRQNWFIELDELANINSYLDVHRVELTFVLSLLVAPP